MDIVKQDNNHAGGSIVGGNQYNDNTHINFPALGPLEEIHRLYEKLRAAGGDSDLASEICDDLEHYLSASSGSDVRGLDAKLTASNREDQLENALQLKQRAMKSIMKLQSSRAAQRIFTIVLTEIHTKFDLLVTPLIQNDAPRPAVDAAISSMLDLVQQKLGENLLELTVRDLMALMYFIGGNCHIRWDKKC